MTLTATRPDLAPTDPVAAPATLMGAGGWPFLVTAFVGRLPGSMVQLGYLMILSQDGRGLGVAGLAVAAVGLGSALGAPVLGQLVDRHGPLPVLGGATLASLVAQALFLVALLGHSPTWTLLACALAVGAANPQVGAVARTHWSHVAERLRQPALVSRALGYEGAADEVGFVVGPVLAAGLVSLLGPAGAAVAVLLLTLVLQGAFVAHLWGERGEGARHRHARAAHVDGPVDLAAAAWPMLACLGVGTLFGATQTGLTAMLGARGQAGLTGLVYGCVGVGSGVASVLVGALAHRLPVVLRVLGGALLMAAGGALMMLLPSLLPAVAVALLLGTGAGITLISCFAWMEGIAPRHRVATMMTLLTTCLTLGVSVGAATAGQLAVQPAHAFVPVLAAGLAGAAAAGGMRRVRAA